MLAFPVLCSGDISANAFSFLGSGLVPSLEMVLQKYGTNEHLKLYLSLFNFIFTNSSPHISSTLGSELSCSLTSPS